MIKQLLEQLQIFIEDIIKVGNYILQPQVILSPQIKTFLLECSKTGGSGTITSALRSGNKNNLRSHASGNKFDLKMDDIKNDYEKVANRLIPIMENKRCKEVALECFGKYNNNQDAQKTALQIKQIILNKSTIIKNRIQSKNLILWTDWGWNYSTFTHADILIQ